MNLTTIEYRNEDGIATLTFNRPAKRNALDLIMRREIAEIVSAVNLDDSIRALIVTGSGGSFCSGGDIATQQTRKPGAQAGRLRMRDNWDWVQELIHLDRPVIAAVDGPAMGAGFNIALAADFILATPRATFGETFAKIGLVPDVGGLYLLPRIVGLQRAKEIVFSARTISAEEARELSIVYEIHPEEELQSAALELAKRVATGSPTSFGMAKGILNGTFQTELRTVLELEASANGICFESEYHKEAISRFLKKETPMFVGLKSRSNSTAKS